MYDIFLFFISFSYGVGACVVYGLWLVCVCVLWCSVVMNEGCDDDVKGVCIASPLKWDCHLKIKNEMRVNI